MQSVELIVSGMMCEACQSHVTKALQNSEGVHHAAVDFAAGKARVQGDNLNVALLIEAIEEEGYGAKAGA